MIVLSILLAFGIDAWWDEAQDRREERLALLALHEEFRANLSHLSAAHEVHRAFAADLTRLEALLAASPSGESLEVVDSLLVPLISFRTPDPATGTLNTLLASGRIDLIRDQELQQALAGWPSEIANAAEDEVKVRDFVFDRLIPGLAGHADLTGVMASRTSDPLISGKAFQLSGRRYEVRVNDVTRTLIGERALLARIAVAASSLRLTAAENVLTLLEGYVAP